MIDRPGTPTTPTGPLAGWRVLVPRPVAGGSPAAVALAAVGAEAVLVPLVATVPPDDLTDLDDALLALGAGWYGWLAVTSAAAVPALVARAAAADTTLGALVTTGGVRVAAVGPGTARALREAGVEPYLVPRSESTAAALVAAWPAPDDRPRVLFPRGDLAAPTLAEGLRARGWRVDDVVVYRTVAAPPPPEEVRTAWASGEIRAALLTSASTVRELHDRLGPPPAGTLLVAIGPTTAAEADRLGLPLAGVAATQTMAGLVAALVDATADPTRTAAATWSDGTTDAASAPPAATGTASTTVGRAGDGTGVTRPAVTGSEDAAAPPPVAARPQPPAAGGTLVSPALPSVPQQPGTPGPEEIA
ncbi:uroporphyrinogen-III synthase [Cellulomonas sp.]|uniref:uroporphyrinogen-III synthase n=1 Tax=Cellulomonas sp. TaxID=40001 RepID=UPI001B02CB66|nr:uroporphyrinogen-III synthase [Cellulomonas sp.]MBO9554563.1 uroporphyrinogen-III synthase [Cellulomonas sp.]